MSERCLIYLSSVYFLWSEMIDASVIATRDPIWLEFGSTVKIARANFSLAAQSDVDDRSSVSHVLPYPAHGSHYSPGAAFQTAL